MRTSRAEIAKRARISPATLYRRFGQKADVVQAVGLREVRPVPLHRLLVTEPETVLPLLTLHGGPVLALGRDYLAEFTRRLQREGSLPRYDPVPLAEMFARVALTMALLPESRIPLGSGAAARRFARAHIVPAYRLATA